MTNRTRVMLAVFALTTLGAVAIQAQDPNAGRALGVVTKIDADARQIVLKTDAGAEVTVALLPVASFRRVAPGETDLRNAATIALTDVGVGDRVLARGKTAADQKSIDANLIVVMSQNDIAKRQAAERADWDKRGANGVVTAAGPEGVTISIRGLGPAKALLIVPAPNAIIRRYAPDSVKFADAKPSTLADVKVGDQVRARGAKNEDGSKMTAEEIVSGSFRTIAGLILSIDAEKNEIRINDLETKKPLVVKIQSDSSVKKLAPQVAQLIATRVHGAPPAEQGGGEGKGGEGKEGGGPGRGGRGGGGDIQQMLDRMPAITLADLKNGDAVVVSSTVGASAGQVTAITLLAGVEPILTKPGTRQLALGDWNPGDIAPALELPKMISSTRALVLVWTALPLALLAQGPGSWRGQVLDPSGAAVPKATVTVSGANNVVKVVQTDNDGNYSITGLPAGPYTIRVAADGFSLYEKTAVALPAGRPLTLDVKLSVATGRQEVTVADTQSVALDPSKNAGALVLKEADLDMLPDDPDDLQADLLALAGPAAGPNGGQLYIDGFSNGQLPPKESIREIRINSNPFSSEFDAPGYGRIEILTKPGSDKFRGTITFNYGDSIWNARNPYSPQKPFYDTKNLNANLSGPIIKNKMSFFIDYARRDERDSDLINAQLENPLTLQPLTLAESVIAPNLRTNISPRIDYQLSHNITLQGRYSLVSQSLGNQGIGGTNLPAGVVLPPSLYSPADTSTAYSQHNRNQTVQLTETAVINTTTINETRFQYFGTRQNQIGDNSILNVQVIDEFAVGSSFPKQYTNQDNYELQNYTSITHGAQFIKFGGRFREADNDTYATTNFTGQYVFDSLSAYQANTPAQYIIAGGIPFQEAKQFDAGLFLQDDWKVKPSLTLSLGARYEIQQNISDYADWAPRVGLAWGIGKGQGRLRTPKTVLRAGYGWFYTRFPVGGVAQAERYNGVNQLQYIVQDPCFYPQAPTIYTLASVASSCSSAVASNPLNIYKLDSDLHAGLLMQSAVGIDRQLPKNTTLSVNYINSRGIHQLRTVNINTPLPGTYSITNPGGAAYPYASVVGDGVLDLYESTGTFKQNQLIFNVNSRMSSKVTLFGYYVYGHAHSDILGQTGQAGQPSNPYDFAADWGRATYDIRHRVNVNGSIVLPFGLRLSPNLTASSAPPFNITEGIDQFGDSVFNARPAFVPSGGLPGVGPCTQQLASAGTECIANTKFGNFVVNPQSGLTVIPANYGVGFPQINVNMRISRTWGWGETTTTQRPPGGGRGGGLGGGGGRGGGGRPPGAGGPGGGGGFFGGGDANGKKYTVTLGLYARNIFNTVNQGLPEGDLLSPRFGESLALASAGQGATQSANRRMELNLRFGF